MYGDIHSYNYVLYPNGDVIIYKPNNNKPDHLLTLEERTKDRVYSLSYHKYRLLTSAAILMHQTKKHQIILLTLTINSKIGINEKQSNDLWIKFIKNASKTFSVNNYVGVLELTKVGTPHYHFIADFPFYDIQKISSYWCGLLDRYCDTNSIDRSSFVCGSVSLSVKHGRIINDVRHVTNYICKYFTKSIRQPHTTKCYFISRKLRRLSEPRMLTANEYTMLNDNTIPKRKFNFEHCRVHCYDANDANEILNCGTPFEYQFDKLLTSS